MRLTAKGRYAVTALLDLALHQQNGPITLADISSRQEISLSYLEQLFSKLRRQNLVSSVRGPGGGYLLSRDPADIYIAEVIYAVGETVDATSCGGKSDCQHGLTCLTHHLWTDLSQQLHDFLSGISLASLMAKHDIRAIANRQDRHERGRQEHDRDSLINTSALS